MPSTAQAALGVGGKGWEILAQLLMKREGIFYFYFSGFTFCI